MKHFMTLHFSFTGLILAGLVCSATAMLLGFLASLYWFFDLFSHFQWQYALAHGLALIFLIVTRNWRLVWIPALLLTVNLIQIVPLYLDPNFPDRVLSMPYQIVHFNVNTKLGEVTEIQSYLHEIDADLIVLQEVDHGFLARLQPVLQASYPHQVLEPRSDNFGIALFSKYPLDNPQVVNLGEVAVPSIFSGVQLPGDATFYLMATHPVPPVNRQYTLWRNLQLLELADRVPVSGAVLLIGDLNVTPWSPHFKSFLAKSGLYDSMRGFGIQTSWPTNLWPLRIPIDHCLYNDQVRILNRQIGPKLSSDHYPVEVEFTVVRGH